LILAEPNVRAIAMSGTTRKTVWAAFNALTEARVAISLLLWCAARSLAALIVRPYEPSASRPVQRRPSAAKRRTSRRRRQ
jgi:hypothetical protein